jgi:cell fate (sporulation/competence/biofilm development) regulator YmcA (YheA/YmcA/DUF963 family)
MNKTIYEKIIDLADLLNNREEVKELHKLEEKMESNEEVIRLSINKSTFESEYSDLLNYYSPTSKEAKESLKKLYEAKLALDNHPLVREYYELFRKVNEPLHYLEFNLLNKFTTSKYGNCSNDED